MATKYYRPRGAFVAVDSDGTNRLFVRDPIPDCLVPDGHWVLDGREELFEEFNLDDLVKLDSSVPVSAPVEAATAAPGEKRAAKRAAPKQ